MLLVPPSTNSPRKSNSAPALYGRFLRFMSAEGHRKSIPTSYFPNYIL